MKRCQFCAEEIQDAAKVCKHCGRELAPAGSGLNQNVDASKAVQFVLGAVLLFGFFLWVDMGTSPVSSTPSTATEVRRAIAGPRGVTLAQFERLQTGMSYEQAVEILGRSGTEQSRVDLAGIVTVMYAWDGDGSLGANMNAMFQNGGLVQKAQFGLK